MAEKFVIHDSPEDNPRWIAEPPFLARLRRLKAIWSAFRFLLRGGKFKVYLDYSGVDPRILKPSKILVGRDGIVVDVEQYRQNAVNAGYRAAARGGLVPAKDDEPGFRVRWCGSSRGDAWKDAGFDVTKAPEGYFVSPKEAAHV